MAVRLCQRHFSRLSTRSFSLHRGCGRNFSAAWPEWLLRGGSRRQQGSGTFVRPLVIPAISFPFFSQGVHKKKSHGMGVVSRPVLPSSVPIEVSRIMLPDDTNPSGNVHGGTTLHLIEQAGQIVANRHCNQNSEGNHLFTAVLARLDRMDFHQPMFVGEVAQLQAAVTYTSPHSMEVTVDVWAENVITGQRRHTNSATMWYIASEASLENLKAGRDLKAVPVPQLKGLSDEVKERGRKRYDAQKVARMAVPNGTQGCIDHQVIPFSIEVEKHTVLASETTLSNIVLPSDCYITGHMMGGSLMKQMDNAAGICAARHCGARVVTASINAIDFHHPIRNGEVVFVKARMVFTSSRSMQIEVTTEAEGLEQHRRITNTAYFTFVHFGEDGKVVQVPQLVLKTEEEEARFEEGRRRYEENKKARSKN